MTQRLPGTEPLDSLRAKGGRFLSALLDGPATSVAETVLAHDFSNGTRSPMQDLSIVETDFDDEHRDRLIKDDVRLTFYADSSVVIGRLVDDCEVLFPLGVELNKEGLADAIGDVFTPLRVKAGYAGLTPHELSSIEVSDLCIMLHSPECEGILETLFADARRLLEARSPMGPIQCSPSNAHASGFFPPLRGLPRMSARRQQDVAPLHTALQAELTGLIEDVPFLRDEWVSLDVRGAFPERDGTLRPVSAELVMNDQPMDWEVASLIQPILDAYCASPLLVPDRAQLCEYKESANIQLAPQTDEPEPALTPIRIMSIDGTRQMTAHETIEMAALRSEMRQKHRNEIYACADALDIPWDQHAIRHAQTYGEEYA